MAPQMTSKNAVKSGGDEIEKMKIGKSKKVVRKAETKVPVIVIPGAAPKYNAIKRSADSSPDNMPLEKRSVLKDLTNANKKNLPKEVNDAKRVTRSQAIVQNQNEKPLTSPSPQNEPVTNRKSKRLSGKKDKNGVKCLPGPKNAACESRDTSYDTANESPLATPDSFFSPNVKSKTPADIKGHRLLHVVPPGVDDFDAENAMDPFAVSIYAQDIFNHFRRREVMFLPEKYLATRQLDITRGMRAILVDWMSEVQESFELNHESLYLAVKMVDLYLSREEITKSALQLLGSTAMLVAAKFEERWPPVVDDYLYICDDAYNRKQFLAMEIKLLKTLDFDLGIPLSYTFLRRYARCSKQTMELLTLARYVLELSLLEYDMVDIPDSLKAAASLSLALQMKKKEPWNATLEYYSGYKLPELTDLVHRLNSILTTAGQKNLNTIPNKYSHKVFFEVAKIPPLDILST